MSGVDAVPVGPSEGSYEQLYEQAPCGFLSMLTNGTIVRVNRTLLAWTGYEADEMIGKALSSFLDKGSQLFYETRYMPVLRLERELREVSMTMRRADGSLLPILVNSSLLVGAGSNGAEVIHSAVFDSTARRDYELELLHARRAAEASETRVRVLQDAAVAFAGSDTDEQVTQSLVETARRAFSATEVAAFTLEDDGTFRLSAGFSPIVDKVPLDALRPGPESVRTGRFFSLSSLEEAMDFSPQVADAMLAAHLEAMTVVPLVGESGTMGVVACFYGRARQFDEEFQALQTALALQATQVLQRLALQRQLERAALHDQLTGLANRALLLERLDEAIAGSAREATPLAVLFLDLDGFKAVNDYMGHAVGDSVLQQVAARLRTEVRATDAVGRFGGDEFVVICPNTGEEEAVAVANRIRASVAARFDGVLAQFPVTASVGVAIRVPDDESAPDGVERTADALINEADEAMYRSKNAGKDCVTVSRA